MSSAASGGRARPLGRALGFFDVLHVLLVHFGVPLGRHPRHPVYFLVESRLFFDHIDDVRNDYQFWGGVRIHL